MSQTVDSATEAFCEGSKLSVMVNDALTNEALENVTATILRLDDGEEQVAHKSWILLQCLLR